MASSWPGGGGDGVWDGSDGGDGGGDGGSGGDVAAVVMVAMTAMVTVARCWWRWVAVAMLGTAMTVA